MKTIYLVTEGEYSDYTIVGAFSTREKAEEFIAWSDRIRGPGYSQGIEEYSIDSIPTPDKVYYRISILEYHNKEIPTRTSCRILETTPSTLRIVTKETNINTNYPRYNYTEYSVNLFTDSQERAIKAGNEKIRQFQAMETL